MVYKHLVKRYFNWALILSTILDTVFSSVDRLHGTSVVRGRPSPWAHSLNVLATKKLSGARLRIHTCGEGHDNESAKALIFCNSNSFFFKIKLWKTY